MVDIEDEAGAVPNDEAGAAAGSFNSVRGSFGGPCAAESSCAVSGAGFD